MRQKLNRISTCVDVGEYRVDLRRQKLNRISTCVDECRASSRSWSKTQSNFYLCRCGAYGRLDDGQKLNRISTCVDEGLLSFLRRSKTQSNFYLCRFGAGDESDMGQKLNRISTCVDSGFGLGITIVKNSIEFLLV